MKRPRHAPDEILTTILDADDLARVDSLAQERGVTRERMLGTLVRTGLLVVEDAPPLTQRRPKGSAS